MSPAVGFFAALGAGIAGAAALMNADEVRAGVWRLQGGVAAACCAVALLLGIALDAFAAHGAALLELGGAAALAAFAAVAPSRFSPWLLSGAAGIGLCFLVFGLPAAAGAGVAPVLGAVTAAAVLGTSMAAMLLGHWYLVDHGMPLAPLKRLAVAYGVAVAARLVALGLGLWSQPGVGETLSSAEAFLSGGGAMLLLVAAFGVLLPPILAFATWGTLRVPNTQSATGILYVACIAAFVSDLAARGAGL